MHNLLMLRGRFESRRNPSRPAGPEIKMHEKLYASHVFKLEEELRSVLDFFSKDNRIGGALVTVYYDRVIAKSSRIKVLLSDNCQVGKAFLSIKGVRFEQITNELGEQAEAHVFTHFVSLDTLRSTIALLSNARLYIEEEQDGCVDFDKFKKIKQSSRKTYHTLSKNILLNVISDAIRVQKFDISKRKLKYKDNALISLYQTGTSQIDLLSRFGIKLKEENILDESTVMLNSEQLDKLNQEAPYLISMAVNDMCKLSPIDDMKMEEEDIPEIPLPTNEPTVGVIDTLFDENAYFSKWVEYHDCLKKDIPRHVEDTFHGTSVSSIIVDGPSLNPTLDDECGRFKVRHFGVALYGGFSNFEIIRQIRQIVMNNQDIHVWNISLGSITEIDKYYISPLAFFLDQLQKELDIIFVISGTNLLPNEIGVEKLIGSPADSLNSVVVNAVKYNGDSTSYTRVGPVLSFFNKPDVAYYGGEGNEENNGICVFNGFQKIYSNGTSFAAPWITRKLAFLIEKMHLKREIAKALIIDAAAGWRSLTKDEMKKKGYGIVPIKISDVLNSKDDEIKFVMFGTSDEWHTYNYGIPVPHINGAHPYFAKATLVCFPNCERNQGVDYTMTEMDVYLGRVRYKNGKASIEPINDNIQDNDEGLGTTENSARKYFRKWDNVKHIAETLNPRSRPRIVSETKMWGLRIVNKDRRTDGTRDNLAFGVVITLKGMRGIDRYDEFKQNCLAKGFLVDTISIDNQIELYNQSEMELNLE